MAPVERMDAVRAFFESYRQAFERFDTEAIADHFAFPAHLTADAGEIVLTPVADRQAWIAQLDRLLAMYRAVDVASARMTDLGLTELSDQLAQAVVHWELRDSAGRRLYDFQGAYTIARAAHGLRITAIAHNEIPRYRACAARRRKPDGAPPA